MCFPEPVHAVALDTHLERGLQPVDVGIATCTAEVLGANEWRVANDSVSDRPGLLQGVSHLDVGEVDQR
jgi:hypothetical protein